MYCKKIRWGTLVLTVCFCLLPVKTAFADTMVGGVSTSVTQEIGPGVTTTPWERYGEHYIDGQGNPIGGVFQEESVYPDFKEILIGAGWQMMMCHLSLYGWFLTDTRVVIRLIPCLTRTCGGGSKWDSSSALCLSSKQNSR